MRERLLILPSMRWSKPFEILNHQRSLSRQRDYEDICTVTIYCGFLKYTLHKIIRQNKYEQDRQNYIDKYTRLNAFYLIFIHQKISSLQISVDYIIFVQVVHSLGNINCYSDQGRKLENSLLFM